MKGQWEPSPDLEGRAEVAKEAALAINPDLKENKDKKKDEPLASAREVFSFGSGRKKRVCLTLGLICSFVSGCIFPLMAFLFAKSFEDLGASATSEDFMVEIRKLAFYFMGLGAAAFVFMSGQATFLETAADLMTLDFKTQWFDALLRQDVAYYDIKELGGSATIISSNGAKYKKGLGRKLGAGLQFFVTFLGGLVYAFWASWKISLIILTTVPFLVGSTLFLLKTNQTQSARASEGYAEAGSIVQTTVASIRTILSLNAVRTVIGKFSAATERAYRQSIRLLHLVGAANGTLMASMVLGYVAVALYGSYLLYENVTKTGCDPSGAMPYNEACDPSGADVFGALMGITFAASVLPQVQVGVEAFTDARAASYPAIQVMNRKVGDDDESDGESSTALTGPTRRSSATPLPKYVIDSSSDKGLKLPTVLGNIEFQSVKFAYPTRQEANVFDGFSLFIEAGSTVALVGPSGCGKSTVVSLLERFYDVLAGSVKLDFHDLRTLNVCWLRQQIGLVGQEPTLFACSIRDNIAYGNENATQEQIEHAAKLANAHDFIISFPNAYDTQVGDKGAQMSGGQKQRIAIARVLVKKPKILLLDEATSALDSESERLVQDALDHVLAEQNRTTIVIAHRLSTIRNADMIAVVEEGQIVETGNHEELMARQGEYYKLVEAQRLREAAEESAHSQSSSEMPSRKPSLVDLRASIALKSAPTITFKDVHFQYPARPDIDIFKGLNLEVYPGESLALVGPSGHGKSTTIQLIERFYDPTSGIVELDGVDLREINVPWLREQFGLVSQEPVLFDTSIKENIRLSYPDATMDEIEDAAKQANAYDFIVSFPDQWDTQVGEGGTQVSGGQKQRIAIARALLRKPRFLLLDEATSALDTASEEVVQDALDRIMTSKSLTTIMIAHRLSTVRKCDRIAVIADGKVREIGTHDELMAISDGRYRRMQAFQTMEGAEALSAPLRARAKAEDATAEKETDEEEEGDAGEAELDKEKEKSNAKRARLLAKDDHYLFAIGGFGALMTGITFPAWGICFAYVIDLLYYPVPACLDVPSNGTSILGGMYVDNTCEVVLQSVADAPECIDLGNGASILGGTVVGGSCQSVWDTVADDMKELALNITWGLLGIMFISVAGGIALFYGFGKASERMNKRVRDAAFDSLVRQEVGYFDLRPVGVITSQLQEDAALIHSFSGEPIRTLVINLSSVLVGVAISFAYMWPFALLTLGLIPPLGFGAEMEMKLYLGEDEGISGRVTTDSPGGIVVETLVNIRTVASLNIEKKRSEQYVRALRSQDPTPIKTNFIKGCATGIGQFIQMWGIALMFWFGGWLLYTYPGRFEYRDFLISLFALLFSLEGMGYAAQGTTDREKAKKAANRIFELTDRQSAIDPLSDSGKKDI